MQVTGPLKIQTRCNSKYNQIKAELSRTKKMTTGTVLFEQLSLKSTDEIIALFLQCDKKCTEEDLVSNNGVSCEWSAIRGHRTSGVGSLDRFQPEESIVIVSVIHYQTKVVVIRHCHVVANTVCHTTTSLKKILIISTFFRKRLFSVHLFHFVPQL